MQNCYRNWMKSQAANTIFAALDSNARFIGGAVRDALLSKDAQDIDIATPLTPEEVTRRLSGNNIKVVPTGIKHGTVTAVINKQSYEITTLRKDIETFGRHATVAFTNSWEEDAARRDFTINAMSCSQNGEVFDYFGGQADLAAKRLRFVGKASERCAEDYLRILRYFRFFASYGKEVDIEALNACKELASGIKNLSGERIQTEMFKLLSAENPIQALQLMVQTGVITHVIPYITYSNIAFLECLLEAEEDEAKNPILRLATMLGKNLDSAAYIAKQWKFSNANKDRLLFLCNPANKVPVCDLNIAKKLIRDWKISNFIDMCFMGFAYGMDKSNFDKLYSLKNWQIPQFPIKGEDLIKLGFKPSKEMGEALKKAEDWWEENGYNSVKSDILEYIKEHLA